MEFNLSPEEKTILLQTARRAIGARLEGVQAQLPRATDQLRKKCGAFVTLHEKGRLRGCIGYILASKPLIDTVAEAAVSSAFSDPRFPPLESKELEQVHIEISVLSPFRRIESVSEIEVGVHGISLRNGFRSGLLLPQVAEEQGWDLETFLTHTCYKAGLQGDCWRSADTEIEIFSAVVFGEERA